MKGSNYISKALNIIANIFLAFTVIILIMAIMMAFVMNKNPEDAYLFGLKPVYVATDSMEPEMKEGALCIVKKISYEDVEVNDIIMSKIDDKIISHRVVSITEEGIRTKGDNSEMEDAYLLHPEHVKAKVVFTWNYFSNIIEDINSGPAGIAKWAGIIVLFNLIILGIPYLINRLQRKEDMNEVL